MDDHDAISATAVIVSAYMANNPIPPGDLTALIASVCKTLLAARGKHEPEPAAPKAPAVPIGRSVQPDHIICLDCGRKFISLARHLRLKYNLSPDAYRAKWGLPKDYLMVAPTYSAARSEIAKAMGLGSGGRRPSNDGKAKGQSDPSRQT